MLLANVVEMRDERGGWKAADTALWREHLHAATMVGRVAAARVAVELGYAIEADPGPSGRLRHWQIAGVPAEVIDTHSKRAAEIDAECQRRGDGSYRARRVAARTTRQAKEHGVEGELVGRWQAELAAIGWPVERLAASIDTAARKLEAPPKLSLKGARRTFGEVLSAHGELARRKVFARRHVLVEMAPHLFGQDPTLLDLLVDRALRDPEMIPLLGVPGAREQPYASGVRPRHRAGRRQRHRPPGGAQRRTYRLGGRGRPVNCSRRSGRSAALSRPSSATPWPQSAPRDGAQS